MKNILSVILLILSSLVVNSQNVKLTSLNDTTVYSEPDVLPKFPGGDSLFMDFIAKNLNYSAGVKYSGTVATSIDFYLIILDSGNLSKIKVTQFDKRFKSLPDELERVLKLLPKWEAGIKDGNYVNSIVFYSVLISNDRHTTLINISQGNINKSRITSFYNSGVEKSKNRDYEGAISDFSKVLESNSKDIDALYNRGVMYLKLKNIKSACIDWNTIKSLGNTDADDLIAKYCN